MVCLSLDEDGFHTQPLTGLDVGKRIADVPAIGYFGPAHPHRYRPTGPRSTSLFHQPGCSPCLQLRGNSSCRKGLIQCSSLAAMKPAEFIAAAQVALV
jgi:hypothetical protein